ncbi:MAG: adenylate/guanylate cyclase domain-containing protein [Proteobacteria bacterium]|nr:adenylate/guanylate cyclase domain-containing protein [Pseudomonadota bacterium]
MERRLTAIFAADVVGYSRLIRADEEGMLAALKTFRATIVDPKIAEHRGRIVKLMGDGMLAEFPSVVEAVRAALESQQAIADRNAGLPKEQWIECRVGVNLGDVVIDGDDIQGDGVNIAARLEVMAPPGGVCISGATYEQIRDRIEARFDDLGENEFKNISRPVRVWQWSPLVPAATETTELEPAEARPPAEPALALPDKPSIAVLPFDNLSGDPAQEYFADGVVEALTAALSRIRAFFVIARNSAFVYKGKAKNAREIGRDLGVAYLLEGSVQRAGGRVRITVQLIETEGDSHIWAEKYDGSLDDIFDLQDQITEQVAGALQPSIRFAEIRRARRKPPQDMGAYDYAMRALSHVWMLEKDEATEALKLLSNALEIDPDYPLALALAAWCHAQSSVYNWVDDIDTAKAQALSLAERAANISTEDPLILTVLGTVHTFARNYGAARILLERAVALDPNAAWAYSRLGWLDTYADRPEEAQAYFQRALRLSPVDPMNFNNYVGIASALQVAGDDNAAADMFQRALDERQHAHWIHRNLAPALLGAGREREARKSFEAILAAYPDMTVKRFKEAMVFSPQVLDRIGAQLAELGLPEE